MSRVAEALELMQAEAPDRWWMTAQVACLLNAPPEVGRRTMQQAHAEGKVRRHGNGSYQLYDMRGRIVQVLTELQDVWLGAWRLNQLLPELILTRDELLPHLVALVIEGRIDAWWTVNTPGEFDVQADELDMRGGEYDRTLS